MRIHRIFFYLLVIFLPTQLGYHLWPEWAMVLGRRVDYLAPTIYLTDILVLLTLFSWGYKSFPRSASWRRESALSLKKGNNKRSWVFIICLLVFAGLNIFFAASPAVAFYKWIKVLEFSLLGFYIVKTKPSLQIASYWLLVTILYSSMIAIMQFIYQHSLGGVFWWLGERTFSASTPGIAQVSLGKLLLRAYGTFPHPNVLAGFLVATLPLINSSFWGVRRTTHTSFARMTSVFYILTTMLGIVALALTFSRSAIVVGILVSTFLFMKQNKRRWIPSASWRIVGMTIILFSFFLFTPGEESFVVREQLNQSAVKLFFQSPIVGVGLGNFLVKLPDALVSRQIYFLQPVHNIYLLVLSETGIVGLFLFLFMIWKALKKASMHQRINVSLIVLIILGFIDHYVLTLQQGQLLLTLLLAFSFIW